MKRIHRAGLVVGLGLSAALASTAPSPHAAAGKEQPVCPVVAYDENDVTTANTEQAPRRTKADRLVTGLGAFMLGALDRKCQDGKATATAQGNEVTYVLDHNSYNLLGKVAYQLTLTAEKGPDGMVRAGGVRTFSVAKNAPALWDVDVRVQAVDVGTGWRVSVEQPSEPGVPGDDYFFMGNTGGSIAARQAGDIVNIAESVVKNALR